MRAESRSGALFGGGERGSATAGRWMGEATDGLAEEKSPGHLSRVRVGWAMAVIREVGPSQNPY